MKVTDLQSLRGRRLDWILFFSACLAVLALGYLAGRRPTVAAALIVAAVAVAVPRWMVVLAAIAIAQTLPGLTVPGLRVLEKLSAPDLLLGVVVVRWFFSAMRGRDSVRILSLPVVAIALFVAWAWGSLMLADSFATATALARITLYCALFIALTDDAEGGRSLLLGIIALAGVQAALILLGITKLDSGRVAGFYGDPQQAGLLLLAGLGLSQLLPPALAIPSGAANLIAIALTRTRSTSIGAIVALVTLVFPRLRRRMSRLAVAAAVVLLVGWLLIPLATQRLNLNERSIDQRTASWQSGVQIAAEHPLIGTGWSLGGDTPGSVAATPTYNLWINLAASTGLVGMLLFTTFLAATVGIVVRSQDKVALATLPYLMAFLAESMGEMTVYAASPGTITFFAVAGVAVAAASPATSSEEPLRMVPQPATIHGEAGERRE
jgi:O-Antigen ligase